MNKTAFELGFEKGIEIGRREVVRRLLEVCFGPLPAPVREWFNQLPLDRLVALGMALVQSEDMRNLLRKD